MSATAAKEETVKNLKQSTDDLQDELHNAANQAGRKVRGMIDNAGDEVTHVSDRLASEFQTNPLRSGVIALGVGVLLGALLRR
ncbi:MAG: hypothetical protein Dbin4_01982 [Alphaproteobacteria bacterium]|nr:hypothetical protein [Alphaproteobacteria bacterium]